MKILYRHVNWWLKKHSAPVAVTLAVVPMFLILILIHGALSDMANTLTSEVSRLQNEVAKNAEAIDKMEALLKKELKIVSSEEYQKARRFIQKCSGGLTTGMEAHVIACAFVESTQRHKVPMDLALGLAKRESSMIWQTSYTNDHGIMQVNERYWGSSADMSIEENIDLGIWILSTYIDMFSGEERLGVNAYNQGPDRTRRGVIRIAYVNDVMKNRSLYEDI